MNCLCDHPELMYNVCFCWSVEVNLFSFSSVSGILDLRHNVYLTVHIALFLGRYKQWHAESI